MNLTLTSNLPTTPIEAVYQLMRSTGKRPRIAWIPPSIEINLERFAAARKLFDIHGFDRLEVVSIDVSQNGSSARLADYDVVYLSGGDPVRFRTHLLQGNLAAELRNYIETGKMIVASSGGSLQFTKNISVFRLIELEVDEVIVQWSEYKALDIVPYEFLPHLNVHSESFLEKVRLYSQAIDHPIIGVEDGGALIHKSINEYQVVGRASIFRHGDIEIIRGGDINARLI